MRLGRLQSLEPCHRLLDLVACDALALRGGLGVRRFAEQASVVGPGNSGRGEDRNDYKLFHVALNDP